MRKMAAHQWLYVVAAAVFSLHLLVIGADVFFFLAAGMSAAGMILTEYSRYCMRKLRREIHELRVFGHERWNEGRCVRAN